MSDPNCIFCKIVKKEISSDVVYEDEKVVAFLDIHPHAPGHSLLIPKEHIPWFIDLPDEISDDLFRSAKKVAKILKNKYSADYIRLGIVGTDIPHTHIHLVPQKFGKETTNI